MTRSTLFTRRTSLLALGGAAATLAVPGVVWAKPQVGAPSPAFSGVGSDGKPYKLADYRGKTVVLEWTNHECPYVAKHYRSGNMQALQKDAATGGVVWLSVISSMPDSQGYVSAAQANDLSKARNAVPAAVLLDPDGIIGRAYDARVTPTMAIIDGKGTLIYLGGIDSIRSTDLADVPKATPYVKDALRQHAAGQPITHAVTQAYGCTIKYKPTA
ncbi:redoxin family protein [Reyranella sp. CPCC 100927]|uniref:redoxin family protein n=1 Tax=Reyranella sp. CPCC 100927 TaxID=2599616 RepID=UPI0011B567B1|nr:redoxin family protein [Reyranella sp. CPCC 100927]TWS97115.1 redoxin domain-containing protein [Reyranella sp. CPCC 100927]